MGVQEKITEIADKFRPRQLPHRQALTDNVYSRRNTMKFIEYEKMKSENLDWGKLIAPN